MTQYVEGSSGHFAWLNNADTLLAAHTDQIAAGDVTNPASAAAIELSATFAATDGTPRVMRPLADPRAGVFDWEYGAGVTGYLFHLRAGADSVSGEYAIGIGTDAGAGGGILVSHKNIGNGYRLDQQPGAGVGFFASNRSAQPHAYTDVYAGGGGEMVALKTGQGYADGVSSAGSTTFTSATAAFVGGDVGAVLTSTQPTPNALPVGVTIVSVQSATSVTLSAATTAAATGVRFMLGGRAPAAGQYIWRVLDTDASVLYSFTKGAAIFAVPVIARDAAKLALELRGTTGQTEDIFKVRTVGALDAVKVTKDGNLVSQRTAAFSNAGDTTQGVLSVRNYGTASSAPSIVVWANPAADSLRFVDSTAAIVFSRFDKNGQYISKKNAAPADADLSANEMAVWFDPTNGAAKMMIKAKQADGTVKTGSVALA